MKYALILLFFSSYLMAIEIDSSYSLKWNNQAWGSGGLFPAGPPWSMVGPYDFDGDGYGDFIVSSSYTGEYCNGVYHYEAVDDDSIEVQWVHTFYDLSCSYDNFSSVAVADLDGDSLLEILTMTPITRYECINKEDDPKEDDDDEEIIYINEHMTMER